MKSDNKSSIEASVNDIDDHHQQQDALQHKLGEETSLDAETEAKYEDEDQYATQGEDDEKSKQEEENEKRKLLWRWDIMMTWNVSNY